MGISREQALDCLQSADLIGIGMEADAVRRQLHPENVVSYAIECVVPIGAGLMQAIDAAGVNAVSLSIGPGTTFAALEENLAAVQRRFPALRVQLSSSEAILRLADDAGIDTGSAVARLRDAGMDSFAAEDLKAGGRLLDLHRSAHKAGMRTTAEMVFGSGESLADRVQNLFAARELQEQTGGFMAFTLRSFRPAAGMIEAPTAVEYMRTLAVARMVLDNIESIESSCVAQGLKVTQMALRFGANDAGTIQAGGMKNFTEEDLRRVIRDAGFMPVERDSLYSTMFLNN